MSSPDTLPAMLSNVFVALGQSGEMGVAWSVLAGKRLWINTAQSLGNNLAVHEKLPASTTQWSKFITLLGEVNVPEDAWPTVEAELLGVLRPRLAPSPVYVTPLPASTDPKTGGSQTSGDGDSGATAPDSTKRALSDVLRDTVPTPWHTYSKKDLASDDSGMKSFYNAEHGAVFRYYGWQHGAESGKAARQSIVVSRYNLLVKDPKAMLVQITKAEKSLDNFFTRPRGGQGARLWTQPDPANPTSLGDAVKLRDTVRKHTESAQQRLNTAAKMLEEAAALRRVKCFEMQKRTREKDNVLAYEKVPCPTPCAWRYVRLSCPPPAPPRPKLSSHPVTPPAPSTLRKEPEEYVLVYTQKGKRLEGADERGQVVAMNAQTKWKGILEQLQPLEARLTAFIETPPPSPPPPPPPLSSDSAAPVHQSASGITFGDDANLTETVTPALALN